MTPIAQIGAGSGMNKPTFLRFFANLDFYFVIKKLIEYSAKDEHKYIIIDYMSCRYSVAEIAKNWFITDRKVYLILAEFRAFLELDGH